MVTKLEFLSHFLRINVINFRNLESVISLQVICQILLLKTLFIQPEISNKTVFDSDNKVNWMELDDIKTEFTDSQSESSRDEIEVASPNSTKETSVVEEEQLSAATRTSSKKKQPERFGEAIPTNLLKKRGKM